MGRKLKCVILKFTSFYIVFIILLSLFIIQQPTMVVEASVDYKDTPTGVGIARHAVRAWLEDWKYVWGGTSEGACDCSGMIVAYHGVGGSRVDMLGSAQAKGLSNGMATLKIPRIHGLGLHQTSHVGLYLGSEVSLTRSNGTIAKGNAIDQRDEKSNVNCQGVYEKFSPWIEWFKIEGVAYPTTGWVSFCGDAFYYEKGEYVVNCTKTIDGVKYTFNNNGASDKKPPDSAYKATDYEVAKLDKSGGKVNGVDAGSAGHLAGVPASNGTNTGNMGEVTSTPEVSNADYSRADSPFKDGREFTFDEQKRVDSIITEINNENTSKKWGWVYTTTSFIGILLIVYSIALLIAFYIDIFNTFASFSLIGFLSGGRLYAVSSKSELDSVRQMDDSKTHKYISHKEIWLIFAVGIMASALLLSGKSLYLIIAKLFHWVISLFGGG